MSVNDDTGPRLPPLNALKAFEAVARRRSISLAAQELGVTPGAVSQQIRTLESHAGGPLFQREGGVLRLTRLGEPLQPILHDAFEHLQQAAEVIYGANRRQSLTVSVPPSFALKWLTPRLARFTAQRPDIEVWISVDMQLADVAGGRVDVAIRYGLGGYPGVRTERLLDAGVIPVCAPALLGGPHPLRRPADLAHARLIHVAGDAASAEPHPGWAVWLSARKLTGIDASAGPRFDQVAMAIEDAANGRGVVLAPRAFVAPDLASGRLIAPFADGYQAAESAYHVVTRRTAREQARLFVTWLRAEVAAEEATPDDEL